MKQLIDRIAFSLIGLIVLAFLEGVCTLGQLFRFEDYNWIVWVLQAVMVYIAIWASNIIYDEEMGKKSVK
jgi:hypothetical protein